jgi:hypothetical protein
MSILTARYGRTGISIMESNCVIRFILFCILSQECRGNTWPHVTSDGTAFINVTGATITLEFDVRVNSKGKFEFFLLHNQVVFPCDMHGFFYRRQSKTLCTLGQPGPTWSKACQWIW